MPPKNGVRNLHHVHWEKTNGQSKELAFRYKSKCPKKWGVRIVGGGKWANTNG